MPVISTVKPSLRDLERCLFCVCYRKAVPTGLQDVICLLVATVNTSLRDLGRCLFSVFYPIFVPTRLSDV
jgi:hypothetical protein